VQLRQEVRELDGVLDPRAPLVEDDADGRLGDGSRNGR